MEECSICLELMKTDVTLLRCLHTFHTSCILKYRMRYKKTLCPICRRDAIFVSRCNLTENQDGTIAYSQFKEPRGCCNIM